MLTIQQKAQCVLLYSLVKIFKEFLNAVNMRRVLSKLISKFTLVITLTRCRRISFQFEFLPHGQTVKQTVYKDILRRLLRSVRDKRRSLWEAHTWALYHDNAPAHTVLSILQFLAEKTLHFGTPQ